MVQISDSFQSFKKKIVLATLYNHLRFQNLVRVQSLFGISLHCIAIKTTRQKPSTIHVIQWDLELQCNKVCYCTLLAQ